MTKVVILAGGLGTRLSEETVSKPKPMVEVGGKPILWHIMKLYAHHGLKEFIICAGYKQYMIKEFFANYHRHVNDITFDFSKNTVTAHGKMGDDWKVTVVDTGAETMTGGRLKRVRHLLDDKEPFCITYGDGVSDVDITSLVKHHKKMGKLATLTAVLPPARFGELNISKEGLITEFMEKRNINTDRHINGGYMVLQPEFLDYIEGDHISLELDPLERAAREGQLTAFVHNGFWQCMDKLYDKNLLEKLWANGDAPWRVWDRSVIRQFGTTKVSLPKTG